MKEESSWYRKERLRGKCLYSIGLSYIGPPLNDFGIKKITATNIQYAMPYLDIYASTS